MKKVIGWVLSLLMICGNASAQVDTTFIYNNNMPYGSLDIRIAKSATWYYYLQENKTFSFRESAPGVKTDSYLDMTSWESNPYQQGNLIEKNGSSDAFVMNYRLLPPKNYNASYPQGYPLLLILHGAGERANCWDNNCYHADRNYSPLTNTPPAPTDPTFKLLNNDHQLTNGGSVHLKAVNDAGSKLPDDPSLPTRGFPGFVLFPQNLNGWDGNSTQDAIRIVRLLCKKYNIDENRIYIHGLSNGGHGVFETIKRAPWMFAAALTMSALDDGFINGLHLAPTIATIPLWMFQGGKDTNPYPQKTENFIKQFRDAGAVVRYTTYENLGHGTWNSAYLEPDFFTWILSKNRRNLHVFAGNATICGSAGLKLELPAGYKAYQWQLNGQTISGATSATYMATTAGTYKARFSRIENPTEAQWNKWSDPIEVKVGQALPQAQIKQQGTVLLNDLNNFTDARLQAVGDFGHYYWYKDGALIDFPGDQDDTTKNPILKPTMGKGAYTLVTANFDNCSSPASAAKYIFFSNQAPINITAPTNFKAVANASSGIDLSWTDASANENGFEIWRRRKIDATNFSPWEMAMLTNENATSFSESHLIPATTYQYKIRGVSTTGRSNYAPGTGDLEIITGADTQPPSAPKNLVVKPVGVQKMKLTWNASTDNTGIRQYYIVYGKDSIATNSADTTYLFSNIPLNNLYVFKVRAVDLAGNLSSSSNTMQGSTYVSGLYYQHSTGPAPDLDSVQWDKPEFTGIVQTFTLAPKTQEDFFNFRFDGFLLITKAGTYQFRTSSDDGSRLRLDNALLVENDGIHKFKTVTSSNQVLTSGAHRISVDFFDYTETDTLVVEYMGPDTNNQWSTMSIQALKSSDTIITAINPDNGPEDSFVLDLYPNPTTSDNISVRLRSVQNTTVTIQLIDPVGKQVFREEVDPSELRQGVKLSSPSLLSPGVYIVIVQQGYSTARQRVMIRN